MPSNSASDSAAHAAPSNDDRAHAPERALHLTGSLRLVLVINLMTFVAEPDEDSFRHLRGSEHYAAALRALRPAPPFRLDDQCAQIEQDAYTLRIFRSRLLANHFFPTYQVGWDTGMRAQLAKAGFESIERWLRWSARIRLTRNGLAVVTLEQPIDQEPLIAWSERVLELQASHAMHEPTAASPIDQDQWSLGMLILDAFLDSIGRCMPIHLSETQRAQVHFGRPHSAHHTIRLDRYVIYMLRSVQRDGGLIAADVLKQAYAPAIAGLMEGTLVEIDGVRRLPRTAADQSAALVGRDVSSWDEELCLFTGESALIYCPLVSQGVAYVGGPQGLSGHAYPRYWDGIARGIEHVIAFRAEIQQAERRTTNLLSYVPMLTRRVNEGELTSADIGQIDHLATSLADIFDSLPEQRSMAVSSTAFRADYARRKFSVLTRELDVQETLDLVNTNVEQLSFFLSYYSDMRLQWQGQRTNDSNMLISEIVMFLALSSFTADTIQVSEKLGVSERLGGQGVLVLGVALFVVLVGLLGAGWLRRLKWLRRSRVAPPAQRGRR